MRIATRQETPGSSADGSCRDVDPFASDIVCNWQITIGDGAAQIYVPIIFTIGAPGQQPQPMRFLMNLVLVKTPSGWKVSSILPIPAPAQ